jgi:mono/diheme cytochrome c family protein
MKRLIGAIATSLLALAGACSREAPAPASVAAVMPALGTQLSDFPDGPGQATARATCLACHSADLVRQQRLTEKQWAASIDKMVRWGTVVPEDQRAALIGYLVKHFGPDNDRFTPVVTRPAAD